MTNKPVWLLDVDGVINACARGHVTPKSSWPEDTWSLVDGIAMEQKWPIRYSSAMVTRINELAERCEVRWHTTWQHDAPALGELLGLSPFTVEWDLAEFRRTNGTFKMYGGWIPDDNIEDFYWWKMYHAVDVVNLEHRPLIWTDDDLGKTEKDIFKKHTADAPSLSICFVTPRTDTGLTSEDLDTIEQFINEVESR